MSDRHSTRISGQFTCRAAMAVLAALAALSSLTSACSGTKTPARSDAAPASSTASAAGADKAAPQLLALLPTKDQVPGWSQSREPRGFTADNLWEQIDGAADSYVAYGVESAVFADYKQASTGDEAVIEIYQLKDPLNAWGKYADERHPDFTFVPIGNEGYTGSNLVHFWSGACYVKIRSVAEQARTKPELTKLAQSIVARIASPGAEPREVSFLPARNQVARSARYIPANVLSQSFLTNGFQAEYRASQKTWKLVLMALQNPGAAQEALTKYQQAVAVNGRNIHAVAAPGDGGFAGQDEFAGTVVAVRAGHYLAAAVGVPTEDAGIQQLTDAVRRLK